MVRAAVRPASRWRAWWSARLVAGVLAGMLSLGVAAGADARAPGADDGLVYYLSPESVRLFDTASERDKSEFWPLSARFVSEVRQTFCGVASSVMVLNALGIPPPVDPEWYPHQYWTQSNIFTASALKAVPSVHKIEGRGLTLDQLATLLRVSGAKVEAVFASDTTLEAFRAAALDAMHKSDVFVVVNVLRGRLGQDGGGHISPLAAYNPEADRFLFMDVARYKYLPSWITARQLFDAMQPVDPFSGKSRGFLLVSK
ncbi:MAG: phytochelatin synthase family protein [Acetobacteraceae bacterium]|nr:phytochelatin synthase family protein [Acetobacteraceae bacterium]